MNTIEIILVMLLGVGFLILIILSIALVVLMLAIMKNLKRIAERAESATNNVAGVAETITRRLGPLAASGLLGLVMKRFGDKFTKGK